ncbi:hypothetical protein SPBR_03695 [Sporothrix brasiliensis 5110]|uniref:Uncharacterized protein n=1 Tax=Sporothrix brasiliensis 5110 TaxID=1398154 RepID=A0A0C2F6Y7_9PEZI|nr:uncharacterized protein SPBR_03695 [Sporothrix brasiliensis 5110]KIH94714.1 hypothetical protein SPBR_03695 [Sporothrix brasiliensis 5110]
MPDHAPPEAVADAGASRPPVTPTTPNSPFTGSFTGSFPARLSPARSFNLHALGFNTSPLGPLDRRISFYGGDGDTDSDGNSDNSKEGGGIDRPLEGSSNDGSSLNNDHVRRGWQTGDDGRDSDRHGLDDPIALEERKDVLIDRLNDMVRHVTSYAPSSPSLSNRSASTWNSPVKSTSAESRPTDDGTVLGALHAHVDEMEAVLAAAQAAEAAAAAASPRRHRHHPHHHHHYPWQRPERRSRMSTPSVVSDKSPGLQGQTKWNTARRTTLAAAPILFRGPSSSFRETPPPRPDEVAEMAEVAVVSGKAGQVDPPVIGAVAVNSEALAGDLSAVLSNLLKRRQESETIQEALLQNLAAANSRTAKLEAQIRELTAATHQNSDADDICDDDDKAGDDEETATETATEKGADDDNTNNDNTVNPSLVDRLADLDDLGSELSFLRLQLRGIEVRCRSYVPADADPELTESIENWKADWSALRAKVDEERRSTTTSMNTSMNLLDKSGSHSYNSMDDLNSTF